MLSFVLILEEDFLSVVHHKILEVIMYSLKIITLGVIGHVGRALDFTFLTGVFILDVWLTQKDEDFLFSDVPERPISSLLCGFSAPIHQVAG